MNVTAAIETRVCSDRGGNCNRLFCNGNVAPKAYSITGALLVNDRQTDAESALEGFVMLDLVIQWRFESLEMDFGSRFRE